MNDKEVYVSRIDRGMKYLDDVLPGWEWNIDLGRLSLVDACNCVLGQLAIDICHKGTYMDCRMHLKLSDDAAEILGFTLIGCCSISLDPSVLSQWNALTECWIAAIQKRRSEKQPPKPTPPDAVMLHEHQFPPQRDK